MITDNNLNTLPSLAMAGSPIVVTATSSLGTSASARMAHVVCVVSNSIGTRSEKIIYSIDNTGTARFNIGPTLMGMILHDETFALSKTDGVEKKSDSKFAYKVTLYDECHIDGTKLTGTTPNGIVSNEVSTIHYALAGEFSDYIRTGRNAAISNMTLSRKPTDSELEHVVKDMPFHYSTVYGGEIKHHVVFPTATTNNYCCWSFNPKKMKPIIFRNSFGELESCMAWCREKIEVSDSAETFSVQNDMAFSSHRTQVNYNTPSETSVSLSTGALSPKWMMWWAEEPLRSRRAWIWISTDDGGYTGEWVPCVFKRDGSSVVLDRNSGASDISFKAVLDYQGGLL